MEGDAENTASSSYETSEDPKFKWTIRKKLVLFTMCIAYFIALASVSIISPFFPTEAMKMGASETVVGLIFSAYPLLGAVLSPLFGMWLPKIGSKFTLIASFFVSGGALILFGFLPMMPKGTIFIVFCFLLRCVDAIAGTGLETAYYMILINEFPENLAAVMGLMETFIGLGLVAGPPLGGALYAAGGFRLPFFVMGGACWVILPLVWFLLPKDKEYNSEEENISLLQTLKIPAVALMAIISVGGGICLSFLEPTFAPYLKEVCHLSPGVIGLIFLVGTGTYTVTAPLAGWLADRTKQYVPLMTAGFVGTALGFLLIGPAPFLVAIGLTKGKVWLVCVSMVIIGLADSFSLVPVMPYMIYAAKSRGLSSSDQSLSGAMSGIYGATINIGAFVGPTLGGALDQHLHFPWATTILAFIIGVQALCLVVFSIFCRPRVSPYQPEVVENAESGDREPLLRDSPAVRQNYETDSVKLKIKSQMIPPK